MYIIDIDPVSLSGSSLTISSFMPAIREIERPTISPVTSQQNDQRGRDRLINRILDRAIIRRLINSPIIPRSARYKTPVSIRLIQARRIASLIDRIIISRPFREVAAAPGFDASRIIHSKLTQRVNQLGNHDERK